MLLQLAGKSAAGYVKDGVGANQDNSQCLTALFRGRQWVSVSGGPGRDPGPDGPAWGASVLHLATLPAEARRWQLNPLFAKGNSFEEARAW